MCSLLLKEQKMNKTKKHDSSVLAFLKINHTDHSYIYLKKEEINRYMYELKDAFSFIKMLPTMLFAKEQTEHTYI